MARLRHPGASIGLDGRPADQHAGLVFRGPGAATDRRADARRAAARRGAGADGGIGRLPLGPPRRRRRVGATGERRARPRGGRACVEALGRRASASLAEGDLVVLAWTAPCGRCAACRRDEPGCAAAPRGSGHRLAPRTAAAAARTAARSAPTPGSARSVSGRSSRSEAAIPIDPRTPPEIAALIGCARDDRHRRGASTRRECGRGERGRHRRGRRRAVGDHGSGASRVPRRSSPSTRSPPSSSWRAGPAPTHAIGLGRALVA